MCVCESVCERVRACMCVHLCVSVCVSALGLEALGADERGHEGPHVEEQTDPARHHLDPEHRPAAFQNLLNLVVVVTEVDAHRPSRYIFNKCNHTKMHVLYVYVVRFGT